MTAITYNAKRGFVEDSFSVSGTSISANGSTDEFNSTSASLAGLTTNDYIYVSGFSNAANNGWHIVSGASSSTNLPVHASALTTESAGNTVAIQQYVHYYGLSYQLEIGAADLTIWEDQKSSESTSQGGLGQSILQRIEQGWDFRSDFIADANVPYWREFLQSVMAREPFTFDPYGTIASADDPLVVELVGRPSWSRVNRYYWQVAFKVREL